MESFDDQWTRVAAMTKNCPFVIGRPVVHTSGSMSTVKEGFFMRYGVSFICVLLGLITLTAVMYNLPKESNHGDLVTFLILLLGALFVFFGVIRTLSIRRICWNENVECLYVHYGWLWNRHILQIPREAIHVKMSVAGETKWFSHFYQGDTILSLELTNRNSAFLIHLLSNSSRESICRIAERLPVSRGGVADSTLAREIALNGRIICFPMTAIGCDGLQLPATGIHRPKQGQFIFTRKTFQGLFWIALIVLGCAGIIIAAGFFRIDWEVGLVSMALLVMGVIGWFTGSGTIRTVIDFKELVVSIYQSLPSSGRGKRIISFEQIEGLQICARFIMDEGPILELNLVVSDVSGVDRVNLVADYNHEKIMSYAQQIAAAMNKPIFDHSMIKKKTLADTIII
jgi:hypothetical protein